VRWPEFSQTEQSASLLFQRFRAKRADKRHEVSWFELLDEGFKAALLTEEDDWPMGPKAPKAFYEDLHDRHRSTGLARMRSPCLSRLRLDRCGETGSDGPTTIAR
jgi:hypothetical protein